MGAHPNIVWLTLDSVRNDRTTTGGYHRDTTPNLKRIADSDGGRAFRNCIAHAIWSLPSDASILTGTYPSYHGTGLWNEVLPPEVVTVPERLADLGYHTVGLSHNAYCSDSTGLTRGFDEFDWIHRSNLLRTAGPRLLARYLLQLRRHSAGYTAPLSHHRLEYVTTEVAKRQLSSLCGSNEPFFQFVHIQGTHVPYVPPLAFRDEFTRDIALAPDEAAEVAFDRSSNYYREIARGCDFSPEVKEAIDAMYDGLLAYVDRRVGALFDHVQELDLGPTVFVVTADHGDLLGEHGVLGHQLSLHDGLLNVPMVIHGPTSLVDLEEDVLCQHADVVAALLRDAGADPARQAGIQGTDPRVHEREVALSQRGNATYETAMEQMRAHHPTSDLDRFEPGLVHAVRDRRFKLLRSDRAERLFELPDEDTDVSASHPDVLADHRDALARLQERIGPGPTTRSRRTLSKAMERQLSDLGYVT